MTTRGDIVLQGWPAGLNNVAKDVSLPEGSLREALNVDLDNQGKPKRRSGYAKILPGIRVHSLHTAVCGPVFVEGTELTKLYPDHSIEVLGDLGAPFAVSFATVNDETFLTNRHSMWRLQRNGTLVKNGVPEPAGQPTLSFDSGFGAMEPGRYLLTLTYLSETGEESGASLSVVATLSQRGALLLSNIPQSPEAASVCIFCTEPNGAVLREFAVIPMGVTSYNLTRTVQGRVLEAQFMQRLPAGQIVRHYNGRLYVASGNTLWYSESLRYGLCNPANNFFSFPEEITILEPSGDGLYVVADGTYFLQGADPKQMRQSHLDNYRGIRGTGAQLQGSVFDPGIVDDVAFWYSTVGAVMGMPGGSVRKIMDGRVALPSYEEGATLLREENGLRHVVTALRGSGADSQFAMGDDIAVTVRRNGITL